MEMDLKAGERIDQLMTVDLEIIQSSEVFSFSLDALLLNEFTYIPTRANVKIVDLCSGNGVIPLLLSQRTKGKIIGIELQERLADMAKRSVELNHLGGQIDILQADIAQALDYVDPDSVDVITVNPPYYAVDETGRQNPNPHLAIARHEIHTNLDQVLSISSKLLKMNGRFFMVHRPERLVEIMDRMRAHRLALKQIQFVYPKKDRQANILLVEGIKDGKETGLKVLPPLYIHGEDGQYLPEIRKIIYGRED